MTISRKFTLWITGIVVAVGLTSALMYYRIAVREEINLYQTTGKRMGSVLEQSIAAYMMSRQRENVQLVFKGLAREDAVMGIHLIDQDRVVRAGTDQALLGREISGEVLRCHGCHERGQGSLFYHHGDTLRYVQHLENRKECQRCHDKRMKYNGALIIDFNSSDISQHVRSEMAYGYMIFVPALGLIGLVVLFLSRELIQKRVFAIIGNIREMRQGKYGPRLPVTHHDEISELEGAFNDMAHAIEERERERELLFAQVSRSFETWQSTFDSISDLISINDVDGNIIKTNAAFLSYFGLTASQAAGTPSLSYFLGSDALPAGSPFEITLKERRSASQDIYSSKLGRHFHVTTYPYAYHEAEFEGFVLVARDITEEKTREYALRESEERFRQLAEHIPEVFWIGSPDWQVISYISTAYEKVWGRPCEAVYERPFSWMDAVVEEDRTMIAEMIPADGVIQGNSLVFPPYRIVRLDGEQRWIFARAFPIRNDKGEIYRIAGIAEDITELKRAEEFQRESKENLQLLIDRMPIGLIIWDRDFAVRMWNPFAEQIFGYGADEVTGRHAYDLIVPSSVQPHVDVIWQRLRQGDLDAHSVNVNITKDGAEIICEWHNTPLYDRQGNIEGVISMVRDVTERVRAQTDLNRALELAHLEKAKSESIIAAIGDGVLIMDRAYRIIYQNEKLTEMVGNHVGELCYKAFEGRETVCQECPVAMTFEDGCVHSAERLGNTAGEPIFVETTSSPLRDADGAIVAGIEVVRDIRKRKKQEEAIRRNLDMQSVMTMILQLGLEAVPLEEILTKALDLILAIPWLSIEEKGSIFVVDPGDGLLSMKAEKGLSPCVTKECSTLRFGTCLCGKAALTQEVLHAPCMDDRHELCSGSEPHGHYCVPIISGGTTTGVLNLYLKEGHPNDEVEVQFLGAVANALAGIIQRKLAEQERERLLRELDDALFRVIRAQKEWVSTFDSIKDMIAIIDKDFKIMRVNMAFAKYYGMSPQEVIGKTCFELVHKLGTPINVCPHRETLEHHRTSSAEIVDHNTQRTFMVTTFPYYSPFGEMAGTIHISRDITEERSKEMRLIMSERLASLGQMASGIAHEINNPLAAIGGCAEGLLNRVKQGRIDQALFENYLGIIQEEVMRCKNITGGMLSIVRQSSYEEREVDLNELLGKSVELVNFQGRLKDVEVIENYDKSLPLIRGNEGELKQAFLAIVSNALDAMDERGTLTIETRKKQGRILVNVTDTGCGIPAEHINRIFDPFFTLKSARGGTGLGLAITSKIIANHKGEIKVISEEGAGTTFTVSFGAPKA